VLLDKTIYQKDENGEVVSTNFTIYDENGKEIKQDTVDDKGVVRHFYYEYLV
jgi:hypothetical protein